MSRILVTGGAGFIGSHLCEALVARGDEITCLDDLSTGRTHNLDHLARRPELRFVEGSVLDGKLVEQLISSSDSVIHLASTVGVRRVLEDPLTALRTIVDGTQTILDRADPGRHRILIASSSEVYGKNQARLREDADIVMGPTTTPRWTYGAGKAIAEMFALAHHHARGLPIVIARLFNTVGPRQSPAYGMVLPRFIDQALRGEPLTVYGDGEQSRCFCHVSDAVRALIGLHDHPRVIGQVVNVASPERVTILDLAERVVAATRSSSDLRFISHVDVFGNQFEETPHRDPDITRIGELIGWRPEMSLNDTIAATITATRAALATAGR